MDDGSRLPRRGPAKVIDWIQGLFSGVFHFFKREQEDSVTEKEIISMVDEAHEKGVLQKDEAEMIQNIFAFEDKEVGVVMTHRSSVAAFAMDDLLKDVVNHMMEEENSRYPVCGEDMDDIRGLIHYKDALKFFTQNPWAKFKPLKELQIFFELLDVSFRLFRIITGISIQLFLNLRDLFCLVFDLFLIII